MGLLGIETERKSTKDHLRIQAELMPVIADMFKTKVKGVKFYHKKETHGDLDLLILNHGNLGNIAKTLEASFGPVFSNGNVYSFEYDKYQVDIIPQPTHIWDFCHDFFDYDPSGNLMGKIARKFGLKYGFNGLVYPFRTFSGRLSTDIIISTDSYEIFKFLGYDYDRYLKGFDTTVEIFEWIIAGKYFNMDSFRMENLNHIDRKRNKKRSTYNEFLEYAEKNNIQSTYIFEKDKDSYIDMIDQFFPDASFKSKLENLRKKDEENKLIASKFNGRLVMDWIGIQGKELGKVLCDFELFLGDSRREFFLDNTEEYIEDFFKSWYKNE